MATRTQRRRAASSRARTRARRAHARRAAGTEKLVPLDGEATCDERRLHRRCPGQHRHRDSGVERRCDEPRAWIVDRRETGVTDQRDPLTGPQSRQELRDLPPRCARGSSGGVSPGRAAGAACGFVACPRRARRPRRRSPEHPQRHIVEVPDRRRADGERHRVPTASLERSKRDRGAAPTSRRPRRVLPARHARGRAPGGKPSRWKGLERRIEHEIAVPAKAAADHDQLGIEDVDEARGARPSILPISARTRARSRRRREPRRGAARSCIPPGALVRCPSRRYRTRTARSAHDLCRSHDTAGRRTRSPGGRARPRHRSSLDRSRRRG